MTGKGELGALLHQLRNRLNNISMNAELAKLELPQASSPGEAESLAVMPCLDAILDACRDCAEVAEKLAVFTDSESSPAHAERE